MRRKQAYTSLLYRLFGLLMAFYVINLSIDAPDYSRADVYGQYHDDLSINEMESVGELVLEKWLGLADVIPEHDEPDEDSTISKSFFVWLLSAPPVHYPFRSVIRDFLPVFSPFRAVFYRSMSADVIALPPEPNRIF
ncbi:hypothetical protein LX87_01825 [Larkinella arboricola]|uniref:Uncharacterized protein n=1 Tax=Larkinella arboricola TaxID=643671 RepID=A0A327X8Z7_LARAB|nr:hypothetical protein [Larkinella arboricola]RAK00127.1 hypothetical protein LX87_01825 [Larkinella arboricola]